MHTEAVSRPFRISVIIPTYQAGPPLKELLHRLRKQTFPPDEIIVVDSSSDDGTPGLAAAEGASVFSVQKSEFDHGGTRNYAAGLARGDILVFMTQDAMPADEHLLERLTEPLLRDERISSVYARQLARPDAKTLERLARSYNYPPESSVKDKSDLAKLGVKTFFCSNVCAAVRRDIYNEVGRFPEPVIFNEDMILAAKCILSGYKIAYAAEAKVIHSHSYTLVQQFKRFFDNGVSMSTNEWIYEYSAVGGEGSNMVRGLIRDLHRNRQWHQIPLLIAESAAKLIGYELGKRHRRLPRGLCGKFSMHHGIWQKLHAAPNQTRSMGQ